MTRVALLTRPLPIQDGVAQHLAQYGVDSLILPTLQVSAQHDAFEARLKSEFYDGIFFVSQHAVHFAVQRLHSLHIDLSPHWFAAVGQATAQSIAHHWPAANIITPAINQPQDSQQLWQALHQAQRIKAKQRVLIVRAQTGRDELRQLLANAQVDVDTWACYKRAPVQWSDMQVQQVKQAMRTQGLVIAITSGEGLRSLMAQFADDVGELLQQPIVTLHNTIADVAKSCGFSTVICVPPHEISRAILAQVN